MRALRLCATVLLACIVWVGVARAANLDACRADSSTELAAPCRDALAQASVGEILAHVQPWLDAKRYAPALLVLREAQHRRPGHILLAQRVHEAQTLADEAAWLARRAGSAPERPEVDLALAETRCTRLTGEVALAACEQVLRHRPNDSRLLVARGDLQLTLGKVAEAEASYRAAAELDPALVLEPKIALAKGNTVSPAAVPPAAPPAASVEKSVPPNPALFGRYHALVIGNNAYRHLDRLDTAVNDAKAVGVLLREHYAFEVTLLTDATRADIVEVLDEYRQNLRSQDNLLIYYAGHGWLDPEADKGFWLPVDAQQNRRTQWVSNDTVRDALRAMQARHVLVVADTCFSGTLTRGADMRAGRNRDYVERMARLKSRQVITSGGLEPVADSSGSGHSPFAAALIGALKSNAAVLDATTLFAELRRPVALSSEQMPQFADIRLTGHEGGEFLFVRRK
ncbi:MAG: caspase family protein [Ideonella sp.]|nr:caspase family protein [Ideonella sp.]MCC7458980.1 caspase family protein [Nitrospira sp.]